MKNNKYMLPAEFVTQLRGEEDTGNSWKVIKVVLRDGKEFKNVAVYYSEEIVAVYGHADIPFNLNEIADIVVTHREDYPKDFNGFKTFEENLKDFQEKDDK